MKKLSGLIVLLLLMTTILAGCSEKNSEKGVDTLENNAIQENADTEVNTPAASEETSWPRTYVDMLGNEVIIEKQPAQVVSVFHAMYPDYLYALGVYPIGAASADTLLNQWAAYKDFTTAQPVTDLGAPNAPNLEKILEQKPDLILAASIHEDIYEELSKIAPTIVLDYAKINLDWKYGVNEFAKILGKEDQAEKVIAGVEETVAEGAGKLEDFRAGEESVIFISVSGKEIWPYLVSQLQVIYDDEKGLGLKAPEGYSELTDRSTALSLEALSEYDPDHIFLMTDYGDETASQWLEELKSNSVWNSISAVQKGNIYLTDRSIFAFNSPIATQYGTNFVVDSLSK